MTTSRCPVCQATFRGTTCCSRCGADLGPLMQLEAAAWGQREACRTALRRGDFTRAHERVLAAQSLCPTPEGEALRRLGAWLVRDRQESQQ